MVRFVGLVVALALSNAAVAGESAVDAAIDQVQREFIYEGLSRTQLEAAALAGIVAFLNEQQGVPLNELLTTEAMEHRREGMRGARSGFGFESLFHPPHGLLVSHVFAGSGADRAGLQKGDRVVMVNGQSLSGLSPLAIREVVQQHIGQELQLTVRSQGSRRVLTVTPQPYRLRPVWHEVRRGIPCVRIGYFIEGTAQGLAETLESVDLSRGLILDVRDNGDGSIEEALAALDHFLEAGREVGSVRTRSGPARPLVTQRAAIYAGPLLVLVSQGTRGPAEWFALALQQSNARATVLGTGTAGVDTGSAFAELPDQRVLVLSTESYAGPNGLGWSGTGVVPNLAIHGALSATSDPYAALVDPPLEKAIDILLEEESETKP